MYCAIRYALWGLAEIYKVRDIIFICPKWQLIGSEFSIVLFCRISPRRDKVMNDSLVSGVKKGDFLYSVRDCIFRSSTNNIKEHNNVRLIIIRLLCCRLRWR